METTSTKKNTDDFCDDEIFDDSSVFANLENFSFRDPNANTSNLSNISSAVCFDEEISGYDRDMGKTWIYPTNYPMRDYQFNIIRAAITKNTLVSLPTGLGKTFIAAVIMYNFYRWYPMGKIVFMAPTRPLVAQQIEACYNIIGLPPSDTVEMTGHMQVNIRKTHWQTRRVVFATPQVIYNDIKSGICDGKALRCLVIDEAHKAKGNYAYCQIITTLTDMGHKIFRILALSATPGSKVEDVISVVKNLHISHLELRNENCIDVVAYSHSRKINTVVIPLGLELTALRQQYIGILDRYARRLKQFNILPQNLGNLSKGRIVMLYKEFQTKDSSARHPQHNYIMKDFTLLIALYHGLELLVKHGSRVFLNFFDEHPEKSWIQTDDNLTSLLERLRDDLGIDPLSLDRSILPDGSIPEMPKDLVFGHPKFYKLKEIMLDHFNNAKQKGQETKAIVFCEYRESVNLVHCLLLQCRPLIVPQMFVGQGASGKNCKTVVSQKQQLRVMRGFRSGACNTLVCTCVAEEGLDVGSVDLILCFDISTRSPIRLVQRCGRTGRERGGQVFILVTEGKEHQTLIDCMRQRDGLNDRIVQSKEVKNNLYKLNPRMIPRDFMPECQKIFITIEKLNNKQKESSKKKNERDIKSMLIGKPSTSSSKETTGNDWMTKQEFDELYPKGYRDTSLFTEPVAYWSMSKESIKCKSKMDDPILNLSSWIEWQRHLQRTVTIGHSEDSKILTDVLQYADTIRLDLPPSSQFPIFSTQDLATQNVILSPAKNKQPKKKVTKKLPLIKSPCKRDGDIRSLFSTATKSTKNYTKHINDLGISNDGKIPTSIINVLVDLCLENTNVTTKTCYICLNVCDCKIIQSKRANQNVPSILLSLKEPPNLPDIDWIDDFDKESFLNYAHDDFGSEYCEDPVTNVDYEYDIENNNNNSNIKNVDIESLSEPDPPVLGQTQRKNDLVTVTVNEDEKELQVLKKSQEKKVNFKKVEKNFDIGDVDDIFADCSEENIEIRESQHDTKLKDILGYFQLDSIEDIFASSDDEVSEIQSENKSLNSNNIKEDKIGSIEINKNENKLSSIDPIRPSSPSILSGKNINTTKSTSPILCSQARKINTKIPSYQFQHSTSINMKEQARIKNTSENDFQVPEVKSAPNQSVHSNSDLKNISDKSMLTITQLVDLINRTPNQSSFLHKTPSSNKNDKPKNQDDDDENIHERTSSPIILTQRDKEININTCKSRKQSVKVSQPKTNESIVIPDSDSEESIVYDLENNDRKDMLNRVMLDDVDDLSIILTQRDETFATDSNHHKGTDYRCHKEENVIDLSSDSDDFTEMKHFNNTEIPNNRNVSYKRKFDEEENNSASPYFAKKFKVADSGSKKLSLQKKILAVLTSNEFNNEPADNKNIDANFLLYSPSSRILSHKENKSPLKSPKYENNVKQSKLDMLQIFRRDNKCTANKIFKDCTNTSPNLHSRKKITFSDSDDDFVNNEPQRKETQKFKQVNGTRENGFANHKTRKKNKKASEFLDLEAELSEDGNSQSGDELTDESVGSIIDFICDENETHDQEDMHALYLKSVKSPVKGVFKIPQLTDKYKKADILSQSFVENDTYEMDSFCVDSHIGLTQVNEVSELELAEMMLEQKRREKKSKNIPISSQADGSPPVKKKFKRVIRRINSDSDDSS